MTDRSDGFAVVYDDADGRPPRRLRFEPRDDGRWDRIEEIWSGCSYWRPVGRAVCERVELDTAE